LHQAPQAQQASQNENAHSMNEKAISAMQGSTTPPA